MEVASSVIRFARKWEIPSITNTIQKTLKKDVNNQIAPNYLFDKFLIALQLDDNQLAAAYFGAALKDGWIGGGAEITTDSQSTSQWGKAMNIGLSNTLKPGLSQSHPLLDIAIDRKHILGGLPHDQYLALPPTVTWAIGRAQALDGKRAESQEKVMRGILDLGCESIPNIFYTDMG